MTPAVIQKLESRAVSMLPPAVMMCIECAADASGDPSLSDLLEEAQRAGLSGRPLCDEPYETVVFDDRVLLRCGGCARAADMPCFRGIGRGDTPEQARQNALYALTLQPSAKSARGGVLSVMRYGSGPAEETVSSCPWIRCAYLQDM